MLASLTAHAITHAFNFQVLLNSSLAYYHGMDNPKKSPPRAEIYSAEFEEGVRLCYDFAKELIDSAEILRDQEKHSPVEYRQLGSSGVRVSAIGLGTNRLG